MNTSANILFLVSNPLDASISIDRDLHTLEDALRELESAAVFDVRVAEADRIQGDLARGDRPRYDILHYLGHGYRPPDKSDGFLIFEDKDGMADRLDVARLSYTLADAAAEFKLAVISACHSESVAASVFALGVEQVVAIEGDRTVYEAAAIAFCRRFYQSLLTGNALDQSFDATRRAIFTDPTMRRLGDQASSAEAAKFKLLSRPGSDPARFLLPVAAGEAKLLSLPALTEHPFEQHPLDFIGRNADLGEVLRKINAHHAAVLVGVSGVGKTELAKQTARRLVQRRRVKGKDVGFAALVNARTAGEARVEVARALGLAPDNVPDNGALGRLTPRGALVILDEAENVIQRDGLNFRRMLESLVSAPAKPLVIVTSQTDPNTPQVPAVAVRRLSETNAFFLFAANANLTSEQAGRINRQQLLEVLNYIDRLPRAIELIARVWRYERGSNPDNVDLSTLLEQLRADHDRVMRDPDYPDEVKSVTVGVQYAYDRLVERNPAAARLWAQLALFPAGVSKAGLTEIFGPHAASMANEIEAQSLVESAFGHFPAPFGDLLQLPTPFRLFALRQLPGGDEMAARHNLGEAVLRYYLDWAGLLDRQMSGGGEGQWAHSSLAMPQNYPPSNRGLIGDTITSPGGTIVPAPPA